ncbi:MAG: DUF72 domain-containing protein [Isosphaeraceae bacterium]
MNDENHPIWIGCGGWSYPDWNGVFYPDGMESTDFLSWYADRFPIVEVDSTFYRPPTPRMIRAWRDRTPSDFLFALKVPRSITHEKQLRDCRAEVDQFLGAIEPLGAKLKVVLLQLGYFNQRAFSTFDEFLEVLNDFLDAWPMKRVPLAVEIRNPRWAREEFTETLRRHGASYVLTEQKWMPRPIEIAGSLDPLTGPIGYVRLLGDREEIERLTTTWERIVIDRSEDLAKTAEVLRGLSRRAPVVVIANNHYAGHSPTTVRELRGLLKIPEPSPPVRPRTTLFD